MDRWTAVNVICVLAAIIHLVFIMGNYINPDQLNTVTSEISLGDMEFPLDIKICAEPAFNKNALVEAGYKEEIYKYFDGKSRYNHSVFGWAEHTNDSGILGSVEEVLNKVRNHKVDDVIKAVGFYFKNKTLGSFWVYASAQLKRLNYPQNCYTVNPPQINKARKEIVKSMWIKFNNEKTNKVTIHLQGRTLASSRKIYDHTFYSKGDEMFVESGRYRKYAVEISKNVYLEEDKSKNCRNYPNADFASYLECDDQYMRDICDSVKLAPVWLYDDYKKVTKRVILNESGIMKCVK